MKIVLEHSGRRFNREWVFRNINYTFESPGSYAILGPNGSGKSTLLQLIAGNLSSSEGKISYFDNGVPVDDGKVYKALSFSAPYLDLIEEFTLAEMIDFHFMFKPYFAGVDREILIELLALGNARDRQIRYYSSGMKQRLKLALAFAADSKVILLDEPTANLDSQGMGWYLSLVKELSGDRLLIVSSNQPEEYRFCQFNLQVSDYK